MARHELDLAIWTLSEVAGLELEDPPLKDSDFGPEYQSTSTRPWHEDKVMDPWS